MKSIITFILLGALAFFSSSWIGNTYRAAETGRAQVESAMRETMNVQRNTQSIVDTFQYLRTLEVHKESTKSFVRFLSLFLEDKSTPFRGALFTDGKSIGDPKNLGGKGPGVFNVVIGTDDKRYIHLRDKADWWFDTSSLPKDIVFSSAGDSKREGETSYPFEMVINNKTYTITAFWRTPKKDLPMSNQELLLRGAPWGMFLLLALVVIMANIASRAADSEKKAYRDPMTGAFNKAWLSLWKKNAANGEGVLIIDCNSFKQINDNFGHAEGDRALQLLAQIAMRTLRQEDIFFRTGGDEFVAVLRSVFDERTLKQVARRIKRQVKKDSQTLRSGPLSISIGTSLIVTGGENGANIAIERADQKMYRYKKFCKFLKVRRGGKTYASTER